MHLIYGTHALGRPVSAPPGIPADRVKALRDAFSATMKDPVFLADAGKQDMPIDPLAGVQTEQVIVQFTNYPPAIYTRARNVLEGAEAK
jgi:hypothetical protein